MNLNSLRNELLYSEFLLWNFLVRLLLVDSYFVEIAASLIFALWEQEREGERRKIDKCMHTHACAITVCNILSLHCPIIPSCVFMSKWPHGCDLFNKKFNVKEEIDEWCIKKQQYSFFFL